MKRYAIDGLTVLSVAGAYFGAARAGLTLPLVGDQVTPFWPPTGIALFALFLFGPRVWPGIALGALAVNGPLGPTPWAVAMIIAGNTLAPLCTYKLLRMSGFSVVLERRRDVGDLLLAGAVGMLVSATAGAGALFLAGVPTDFATSWSVWWSGDTMGILIVAPLLFALWKTRPLTMPALRWAEGVLLLAGVAITGTAVVLGGEALFLMFPLLLWSAFRFRLPGVTLCTLLISLIAIVAAVRGVGPFEGHSVVTQMWILQLFNGAIALTGLTLSSVVSEKENRLIGIEQVCSDLRESAGLTPPKESM